MKIRNGFVSNSSSSSFIVIFPRIPKSAEDVKDMLFDKSETLYYHPYDDGGYSLEKVAETVWSDICNQKVSDFEKATDIMQNVSEYDYDDAPNYDDFIDSKGKHNWEKYIKETEKWAKNKLESFFNTRKLKLQKINKEEVDVVFYCFNYSDNSSSYESALEHGNLFEKLKHLKVNNH